MDDHKPRISAVEAIQLAKGYLKGEGHLPSLIDPDTFLGNLHRTKEFKLDDCWLFYVSHPEDCLQVGGSSRLLCIHKESGDVIFDCLVEGE